MPRFAHVVPLFLLSLLVVSSARPTYAQDGPVVAETANGELTLRELLEKDLRARREVEFTFIQHVVDRVEEKKIPLDTVITMYKWSKQKSHRPYQYFEKGMKVQAKRLGVDLFAREEEDPEGTLANFFHDLRIRFKRLRVQL
jgi:hypothetical protein